MVHLKSDSKRNFDLERKTAENLETLSTTKRGYNEEMTFLENRSTHLQMTEQQINVEFETLTRETFDLFDLKSLLQSKEQKLKSEKNKVIIQIYKFFKIGIFFVCQFLW